MLASYPKPRQQYPFKKPVIKGTDLCMDFVNKEGVDVKKGVASEKGEWAALSPEGFDNAIAIEQGLVSETWQLLPSEDDTQVWPQSLVTASRGLSAVLRWPCAWIEKA